MTALGVMEKAQIQRFSITNGTRQRAILSPIFCSIYCDGMFKQLRQFGVGAHVGGRVMGVGCYADDVVLIAPSR